MPFSCEDRQGPFGTARPHNEGPHDEDIKLGLPFTMVTIRIVAARIVAARFLPVPRHVARVRHAVVRLGRVGDVRAEGGTAPDGHDGGLFPFHDAAERRAL